MVNKIIYPDYSKSLINISASICKYYGVDTGHETIPVIDEVLSKGYKNIVLMLFDGMGVDCIEKNLSSESFIIKNMIDTVSSVYPSTTTAATIALESGLAPIEHGWLGWSLYFKEIDKIVNLFPNTTRDDKIAADYHVARRFLPYTDIFPRIEHATNGSVNVHRVSPFSEHYAENSEQICDHINRLSKLNGQKFIYSYCNQPDYTMHDTGCYSTGTKANLELFNRQLETLCDNADDTVFIITADHGLIDVEYIYIDNYPTLIDCLEMPPSVETRAASFFVKKGMKEQFVATFNNIFSDSFILMTKQEVFENYLFGLNNENPKVKEFIGDFLAVAISDKAICYQGEKPKQPDDKDFIATHAGLTKKEMIVPLFVVEKSFKNILF